MTTRTMRGRQELEKVFTKISQAWSFDGAHLELSSDARNDAIVEFLVGHFFPDEPLSKAVGLVYGFDEFEFIKKVMLAENLSVLLVSDSTDEIIGARIIAMMTKTNVDMSVLENMTNEKLKTIFTFLEHRDEEMDVFRRYGVEIAVHFLALGVHRDFRKRGYASKLMQVAIEFSKELGFDNVCIKSEGTSNFTKRIYEKFGFETLHETMYDDYKIDGEVVFKNTGEHKSTKIYVKQF